MLKIQLLSLITAISFVSISHAQQVETEVGAQAIIDSTASVAPSTATCMSDSKGVPLTAIENNTTLMEVLKPLGGVKGLFYDWETDGGSVKFYPSPAKRLRLEYTLVLSTNIAVITKVCKTDKNVLKLSGHVSGDPFVMFIGITSNKKLIKMSLEGKKNGEWYDFSR